MGKPGAMGGLDAISVLGTLYAIRNDHAATIKIGHSANPVRRLNQLRTGNSDPLRLVGFIAGNRSAERAIHKAFADKRLCGEWFDDSDGEITRFFDEVCTNLGRGLTWEEVAAQ